MAGPNRCIGVRPGVLRLFVAILPALAVALSTIACDGGGTAPRENSVGKASDGPPIGAGGSTSAAVVAGAEIYRRERCGRCHTLDRPAPSPVEPLLPGGPGDLRGRAGPDLGLEGHRHSDDWQYAHLYAPALVVPGTRMPAYRHLFAHDPEGRPVPGKDALDLVDFLQSIGQDGGDLWGDWRADDFPIPPRPTNPTHVEARGRDLYARHCEGCHGSAGDGHGPVAPLLLFPPRDFTTGHFRFRASAGGASDADLFRSITIGGGTGSAMPGFHWLAVEDRWALVSRVRSFRVDGSGPPVDQQGAEGELQTDRPDPIRVAEGRNLWVAGDCGTCHGADGRGLTRDQAGAAWTDGDGHPVPRATDLTDPCAMRGGASSGAILRAVMAGTGGPMPSYADALPTGRERSAIVAYVLSLRTTSRRTPGRR